FQYQTIAQLAAVVDTRVPVSAEQGLLVGPVPLTPIQHWFFAQHLPEPHHYNQARLLEARQRLSPALLEQTLSHLLHQHDALRLHFVQHGSEWEQYYADVAPELPFLHVDISELSATTREKTIEQIAAATQTSLHLIEGPLLRCVLFDA